MGPKLMKCCRLETMGTQDYGNMLKRIQVLEEGRVPAKEARSCGISLEKRSCGKEEHCRRKRGDVIREYKAMHEKIPSRWSREDRRDGLSSVEAFEIFSQGRDLESCGGLSWGDFLEELEDLSECQPDSCADVRVVPDVTDVLVSLSSVVTEFCDGFSCCSDREFVEPQSFSFSKKHSFFCTVMQY